MLTLFKLECTRKTLLVGVSYGSIHTIPPFPKLKCELRLASILTLSQLVNLVKLLLFTPTSLVSDGVVLRVSSTMKRGSRS